jgi:hypothetical protein
MTETILQILNMPVVVALIVALVLFSLNIVFDKRPSWRKKWNDYLPAFGQAVRHAEKAIPDNHPNKAILRADEALKYLIRLLDELGARVAATDTSDLRMGLSATHAELDTMGILEDHKAPRKE